MEGIIKRLNKEKGYGFIKSADEEFFFHRSSLEESWDSLAFDFLNKKKILVEFEVGQSDRGPRAEQVRRA